MDANQIVQFVREMYGSNDPISLHEPIFKGNDKNYVIEAIESTYVSSVGMFVDKFENELQDFTGSSSAIATMNGTAALHAALYASGVTKDDLVITQALTFVATCNVIDHLGAEPIFVDVSPTSLGMCPVALEAYLQENAEFRDNGCIQKSTGQNIRAIVPMHTFGHPVELDELIKIAENWGIPVIEDAAESLGSFYKGSHTGTIGLYGALSFNGNKIITTGGGGAVLCSSEKDGKRIKHLTTTAKVPHPYEYIHDEPGFNFRMPNLNAALGCAQLEVLDQYLKNKRHIATMYKNFFSDSDVSFFNEPDYAKSNYWLNSIICNSRKQRDEILKKTNDSYVMTRPVWRLMHKLPMFKKSLRGDLSYSEKIEQLLINLPSSSFCLE